MNQPNPQVPRDRMHPDLDVQVDGNVTILTGPQACGKTTLLRHMLANLNAQGRSCATANGDHLNLPDGMDVMRRVVHAHQQKGTGVMGVDGVPPRLMREVVKMVKNYPQITFILAG